MPPARPVGPGFFPLDRALGLHAQTPYPPSAIDDLARLGTVLPFAQAATLLTHFTGLRIDHETVRRWTEAAGAAAVVGTDEAVAAWYTTYPVPAAGPDVQLVSVDGAMVPLVGGAWAEVKTLAIGTVAPGPDGHPQTTDLSYCARLTDAATFADVATLETHRRGTRTAGTVVAVTDGAAWIQGFLDGQCADAVRILDFAHAVEHLGQVAQAVFGSGTEAASTWLGIQAHALRHGQEATVITTLADLTAVPSRSAETGDLLRQTHAYFVTRRDLIRYADFVASGYPIGSGSVESANKLLVEARLKGAGMHWQRDMINPMLELRAMVSNDRWNERWRVIWPALCHRPSVRPPAPVDAPLPASAPPPTVPAPARANTIVNGKPTADHPWRRTSPFRSRAKS